MFSHRSSLILFIFLLLLALLVQWPAAAVATWLENQTQGHWRLSAPRGTLWQGSGMLLTRPAQNAPWLNLMSLNWRVHTDIAELLRGRLRIDLEPEQGRLQLIASPSAIRLESLAATLPARLLSAALPGVLGRYHWEGQLQAHSPAFACNWQLQNCQGEIEVLWEQAAVAEVSGAPLGSYQLNLSSQAHDNVIKLAISTHEGRLNIQAQGEFARNGRLQIHGEATAPTQADNVHDASLNALLNLLMRPQGGGRYLIDYQEAGNNPHRQ